MKAKHGAEVRLRSQRVGANKRDLEIRVFPNGWAYLTPAQAVRLAAKLQRWAWKHGGSDAR